MDDGTNKDPVPPPTHQNTPARSQGLEVKKKPRRVPPCLGKFRPTVGQSCHQCTPDSLRKTMGQNSSLGFRNLLSVNETHTRYRGWLVRRLSCSLLVSGCKVYQSPVGNRLERVHHSNRVMEALAAELREPQGEDSRRRLSPFLPLINTCISAGPLRILSWVMLKLFSSVFGSVQVNLGHLPALHRASREGSLLVYVFLRQSVVDWALIPLVLFCNNLRVPYSVCPLHITSSTIRFVLQRVGVILLPPSAPTEEDAETDALYSPVMTSLLGELLQEGQALSVGVSAASGRGGRWLADIRQLVRDGSVPDVSLVPVGISYDRRPQTSTQVGLGSVLRFLWSLVWRRPGGSVRIHLAQPFSLKEMCESGRCRVDEWLPLQDLLLPVILNDRADSVSGQRRMSWLLPSSHYAAEPEEPTDPERDLGVAVVLHLVFSAASCTAVMSTSLMSSLLLHRHRKGVGVSVLCRDVSWLTEELLFRNRDVGFGGSLGQVVRYSLSLLAPHLVIATATSRTDPVIVPRPTAAATLHLALHAQIVTHVFILEAVGACAVSAMLREVAVSGVSSRVRSGVDGEQVDGDMEFDVALGQSQLTERALQLCHLLPPGFMPPCQSSQSFALDAVDSLVRCGILIMEETPRDVPICDFWKREGALTWTTSDDPYLSDSDCDVEEKDQQSYKISRPSQCPELLFFLCSLLSGHLRTLSWATAALDRLPGTPQPEAELVAQIHAHLCDTANQRKQHYESCSEEAAHTAVRSLIDLGVLSEERRRGGVFLGVVLLFQLSENRQKLQRFISQYLYD